MTKLLVQEIIAPVRTGIKHKPSVSPDDRITDAIETMLKNDLRQIAVARGNKVLGIIRLEDALKRIGLDNAPKSIVKRSIVVHGRKIMINETIEGGDQ
ncbi:MAG: CBS domain-containing protein [Deltaproteobacteria bacterium]|nr:CBS domain-containing protein [Deltaproteobacteria bacterium]